MPTISSDAVPWSPSWKGEGQKERALEEQGNFGGRGDFMENFYVIMVQSGLRGFKETDLV
jgi:hypothetical protein